VLWPAFGAGGRTAPICIRLNDENSPFFKPSKGLRQRDPLSPLLFNLVVDVFTRILMKAASIGYISSFMKSLSSEGCSAFSMLMTPYFF
jgi:hypothetical protein